MINIDKIDKFKSVLETFGNKPSSFKNVSTDSRSLIEGDMFIALKGESFNGHEYIDKAIIKGAKIIVTQEKINKFQENIFYIMVCDTYKYYGELANFYLNELRKGNLKYVIGVAGSNGKTTTKNMLEHLLNSVHHGYVFATQKNFNNHVGVPKTILSLNEQHKYLIIELGTNHPGELEYLCNIADPDYGVITNIGHEHLEFFKDLDGVFQEESFLYEYIRAKGRGKVAVDNEDQYLSKLSGEHLLDTNEIDIGKVNYIGHHNIKNMKASLAICSEIDPSNKQLYLNHVNDFVFKDNRSEWKQVDGKKIFLDAYNSNPSSLKSSVSGFVDYLKENNINLNDAFFIVGDMNELGDESKKLHEQAGDYLASLKIVNIAFIGRFTTSFQAGFKLPSESFGSVQEFKEHYQNLNQIKSNYLFLKASRSLQLEAILDIKDS